MKHAKMHSFDVQVAIEYGVNCAVLYETIQHWVLHNKANDKHLHDGRYWTYNSAKAFSDLFPYMSADTIQRALKKLEDAGLIVSGCFNASPYDRTKWYSFAGGVLEQKAPSDSAFLRNGIPHGCGTYTNSYQFKQNTPLPPKGEGIDPESFNTFWRAYPKKVGKDAAEKAWGRKVKTQDTFKTIIEALERHKTSEGWTKDNGQYIPNPATWLNQGRWKDELEDGESAQSTVDWSRGAV